jgi:hypothetical protein
MNVSEFSSEQLVKLLFTSVALGTRPTAWYVALHTGDPTLDGSGNEVGDANYARQSATFAADQPVADGPWRVRNAADVVFPAAAAAFTVTHVSVFSALTAGNALAIFQLPLSRAVGTSGVFSIPINELVITGE